MISVERRNGRYGGKDVAMKFSRSLQLNATVSSIALAAALAFGASVLASAPAAADDTMAQAHTQMPGVADIVRDPTDLPPPIGVRQPEQAQIDLETMEVTGQLNEGTTYHYRTFNGQVPGPFVRVRVGDTVEVHLENAEDSSMMHNIDFHAVTGPGGGAKATERLERGLVGVLQVEGPDNPDVFRNLPDQSAAID